MKICCLVKLVGVQLVNSISGLMIIINIGGVELVNDNDYVGIVFF